MAPDRDRAPARARLARLLEEWVESGEVTAAFGVVARGGRVLWSGGVASDGASAPTARSLFDAASLTKPWMATLALRLDASGELPLSTRIGEVWPRCAARLSRVPLARLLRHRAGLDAWAPFYRRAKNRAGAERLLVSGALLGDGAGQRYSDLDFLLWGFATERRLGVDLSELLRRHVLEPLGIDGVETAPGARADVVPCLCDTDREVELAAQRGLRIARLGPPAVGEPQDGNARFLGGLCAHAGLFTSAEAAMALGREWLRALEGKSRLLRRESVAAALAGGGEYALGWARRRVKGSAGPALSRAAFGHIGFTGGSLWIDPATRSVLVLLAHRRSPAIQLNVTRHRFHRLAGELG